MCPKERAFVLGNGPAAAPGFPVEGATQFGLDVALSYERDGLRCELRFPLESMAARQ
jgi:hypothetical protein